MQPIYCQSALFELEDSFDLMLKHLILYDVYLKYDVFFVTLEVMASNLKLGSVMLFRNTFCNTGWNDPVILRVVNTLCIQKKERK